MMSVNVRFQVLNMGSMKTVFWDALCSVLETAECIKS
jgi:hypothetical protein